MLGDLASKIAQLLPNSDFTVPFELITVYQSVTDIWDSFPLAVRMSFISIFAVATVFCILRMLF